MKNLVLMLAFAIAASSSSMAKEEPQYLYRIYSEADIVARVVVVSAHDAGKSMVDYQLKVLSAVKGTPEKSLNVTLKKLLPIEAPHLSDGDFGIIFLKKEAATDRLQVSRFIHAQDFLVDTNLYLCNPPGEQCQLTKASDVESFFKNR
jgi:hypothetical protein